MQALRSDMPNRHPTKKAPTKAEGADFPAGWGFAPNGDSRTQKRKAEPLELLSTIDTGWDDCTATWMAAFLNEAQPRDLELAASLCELVRRLLWEYMEKGVALADLLLIARKVAARMGVNNMQQFVFVGIVASSATGAEQQRTRKSRQGKTSQFIAREAAKLMHIAQFDENGCQQKTNDEAAEEALETLQGLLPPKLLPAKKTLLIWYQAWLKDQGEDAPRPAIGAPTFK